jgi:uncharacterized protein
MLTGVLDTEMVIGLAKGGVFQLLASIYAPLYVPAAVTQEVLKGGVGRAGTSELAQAIGSWVTEVTPPPRVVQRFASPRSLADRQVLAVAHEQRPDHVLSGDHRLYQVATRHGFTCLRATEVVVLFKLQGSIADAKSVLDRMIHQGYGIRRDRYEQALLAVGEATTP